MSVSGASELLDHLGHRVVVVSYAGGENVAVECERCGCVLVDFEREDDVEEWLGTLRLKLAADARPIGWDWATLVGERVKGVEVRPTPDGEVDVTLHLVIQRPSYPAGWNWHELLDLHPGESVRLLTAGAV
ncbi:MAG: baculoviral IAP repeat-containing protein [Candidatus Dormibacteria bacterium]